MHSQTEQIYDKCYINQYDEHLSELFVDHNGLTKQSGLKAEAFINQRASVIDW
uniref:Uncharacterized protein n=1 Tax=uncultured Desulfobacterium sp. TaxID=201089 RepID=E1YEY3_9BACT|nr:unknown protein [uncultured Desulfobacterium sp.]